MSATFDAFKQTFTLSLLSNLSSDYIASAKHTSGVDPLETQLSSNVTHALANTAITPVLGSGWEIVWGPAVWRRDESLVTNNAAIVFHNPSVTFEDGNSAPTYVVAIAATNAISAYDWGIEDFNVSTTVDWASYNPTQPTSFTESHLAHAKPVISKGTAIGVSHICALTPTNPAHGTDSLLTFIKGLNSSITPATNTHIVFTGHSLAGALSPTFALYLTEQELLSNFTRTLVYPTAGATPGNGAFASEFAQKLPAASADNPAPWQWWNKLIHNNSDIVPHAWNPVTLSKLFAIYGNSSTGVHLPELIKLAIDFVLIDPEILIHQYTPLVNSPFDSPIPTSIPTTDMEFMTTAGTQHSAAYVQEILAITPPNLSLAPVDGVALRVTKDVIQELLDWLKKHL